MGLKENVIVGHLIPAGTGLKDWTEMIVGSKDELDSMKESKVKEEKTEA